MLSLLQQFVHESINQPDVFLSVESKIKAYHEQPCHNLTELNQKNTKRLGDLWETFCLLYVRSLGYTCESLANAPNDWLHAFNLTRHDVGIDLIAHDTTTHQFIAIQCKFRSPRSYKGHLIHRVSWRELSTFLSLVYRTGPLQPSGTRKWHQCWIMTNAEGVSWKGHKTGYEKTIARETWKHLSHMDWLKWLPVKEEIEPMIEAPKVDEPETAMTSIRELRLQWLDRLKIK